jgi:hypothetical protein
VGKAARGDVANARKKKRKETNEDTIMVYKRR